MFPLTFSFHDSEVKHIRQEQHDVHVVFSAARVESAAGVHDGFDGYALGLVLQLIGVTTPLPPPYFGRLSGGRISAGGPPRSSLVLPCVPFEWAGQTTVELTFAQGDTWSARALKLHLTWEADEQFRARMAC
jgi:hypothetical protein